MHNNTIRYAPKKTYGSPFFQHINGPRRKICGRGAVALIDLN
jgi:hypothetical protein